MLLLTVLTFSSCASSPLTVLPDDNHFRLGETNFLSGKFRESLTYYQTFLKRYPRSSYTAYTLCQMGLSSLALSEYDQAIDYFQKALNGVKDPHLKGRILTGLGNAYSGKYAYTQAAPCYLKVLEETRAELNDEAMVLFKLATALIRSGDWFGGNKYLMELLSLKSVPEQMIEVAQIRLSLPTGNFIVQLGKFQDKENALEYQNELKEEKDISAELKILLINENVFYFLWAGSFPDWRSAQKLADELQVKGVEAIVIP